MATTPNYGWVTPSPSNFVTNLPADFETFADAVDSDLAGLLGGTTGQVLQKDSNSDHDFSWQTPAGGGDNWTLLNTGGTSLTGAATITVSGISGKNKLFILVDEASSANASSLIRVQINADTGSNYYVYGSAINPTSGTYDVGVFGERSTSDSGVLLSTMSSTASSFISGHCLITGCDATGVKMFQAAGGAELHTPGQTGNRQYNLGGYWNNSASVTSVSLASSTGNFDGGTLYVYAS